MKRWFIARMGDYENEGTRVPKAVLYPTNLRIWSTLGKAYCLGQLSIADLTAISADADIHLLPESTLDLTWGSVAAPVRNRAITFLGFAGFATSGISSSMSLREVLVYILQQIQPALSSCVWYNTKRGGNSKTGLGFLGILMQS